MPPQEPSRRRQPRTVRVPNDLSGLIACPVCGHRELHGVLVVVGDEGRWWECSECWLRIPATETARKTIQAFMKEGY